jgi:hypothetical protein
MKKKVIPLSEFESALSAQAPWLRNYWAAFTEEGVVLVSHDEIRDQLVLEGSAKADEDP